MDSRNQKDFQKLLVLWNTRKKDFPNWHGIGICDQSNSFSCFVGPDHDTHGLEQRAQGQGVEISIKFMPPFSDKHSSADLGQTFQEKSTRLHSKKLSSLRNSSLQSGRKVTAHSNVCKRDGCSGTIGIFLEFDPVVSGDPIWLLSAEHILTDASGCKPDEIRDENGSMITANPPFGLQSTPSMDIALVQIDSAATNTSFLTPPVGPNQNMPVMKVGAATKITHGQVVCRCPVMDVGNCENTASPERGNLILIKSLSDQPVFLDVGDSGALVTTEAGDPVAIIAAMTEVPDDPGSPYGLATLLTDAWATIITVVKDPSGSAMRTLRMFLNANGESRSGD